MKVLQMLRHLDAGGSETLTLYICRNAESCGLDLAMVSLFSGSLQDEFRQSGVEYFQLADSYREARYLPFRIRKLVKRLGARIVHTNQPYEAIMTYLGCIGLGVRIVHTYHGPTPNEGLVRMINFIAPRMARNVFPSKYLEDYYTNFPGIRGIPNRSVVLNGVDKSSLTLSGHSIKAELGIRNDELLLGMVCNFRKPKDQPTVCRALAKVFDEVPDIHFVFAGAVYPGSEELYDESIRICREAGIEDRVHFLGSRNDVADILSEMDLFVFSSNHEGLPLAIIEAMLLGVPTVLSDIPAHLEICDDGRVAKLFPVGDSDHLAESIRELIDDREKRSELSALAKSHAKEEFLIERHIERLQELYRSLNP